MGTPASQPRAPEGESADRDPLLGNEYLLGSPDRRKGPHCLFTFLSIDAVIAAQLTPDQLPHSIHDTPPRRMVVSHHGIIAQVSPEPFLSLNEVANMKLDPRLKRFSIWDRRPIFGEHRFPLPKLPERRRKNREQKRTQSGRTGLATELSVTRDGKSEVGKVKGKGKGARRDDHGFDKYRELPSVAAHTTWSARNDARAESVDGGNGYEFDKYRELPSIVAHGAWCASTRTGDDEDIENEDRGGGYRFDDYSELPSVLAHGAWYARTEDGDAKETEEEDDA